jgi:hypothetical protein
MARPLFRTFSTLPSLPAQNINTFVYRLKDEPTINSDYPEPVAKPTETLEKIEKVENDTIDEDKYMLDLSSPSYPTSPYPWTLTPLDQIIPNLPPLSDELMQKLWTPFVPDKYAPTEFLKDVPAGYGPKPKKYLEMKNPHPRDERIVFIGGNDPSEDMGSSDGPHRYYLDGSCRHLMSVTTFLKLFFTPFNAELQAKRTLQTKTFADCHHRPSYRYYGCNTWEDVQRVWNRDANMGTLVHANAECDLNGEPYTVIKENVKPLQQFKKLFADEKWVQWQPFRTEWSLFDEETLITGQLDYAAMANYSRGELVLFDWKRSEAIRDSNFERYSGGSQRVGGYGGKGPCQKLEDCNYIHYSLQLNIYAYMVRKHYGLNVVKMFIIQLHPKNKDNTARVYQVPNLMSVVEEMFAYRKLALRLNGVQK